jgi:hypothetical protein
MKRPSDSPMAEQPHYHYDGRVEGPRLCCRCRARPIDTLGIHCKQCLKEIGDARLEEDRREMFCEAVTAVQRANLKQVRTLQ